MLRAVIFDFDGVITDSEILHYRAFNEVLARYGAELTKQDYYRTYLGLTDVDCYRLLIEQGRLKTDPDEIEDLVLQKNKVFEKLAQTEGHIIEGVRDFLDLLAKNNIPMAICSGALLTEIELILEESNLRAFFEVVVSAEQVKHGKPSPEGFLLVLKKLNHNRKPPIRASESVVVEDSHWGLRAAKAAKMHTVAVTNTYDADQLAQAEKIVAHLGDLSISDLQQLCA
jgi:HAD superfamily hydrolase (TIGR01509 family)